MLHIEQIIIPLGAVVLLQAAALHAMYKDTHEDQFSLLLQAQLCKIQQLR